MLRNPFSLACFLILGLLFACKPAGTSTHQAEKSPEVRHEAEPSSKGFDELSSDYYDTQNRVIWQKPNLVISLLGNLRGKTVADIGAGTGFFAFRIANNGAKVIAVDIDPRAIAWMESEKKRYPADVQALLETRLADPDNPRLKPDEVDVILMVNTYIYLNDRVAYFKNLRRDLRKNAQVIIIDFKKQETPIGPGLDERIAMNTVQGELIQAGYTISMADDHSLEYQYIITANL